MKTLVLSMISIAATVAAMTACTSESDPLNDITNPQDEKVEIKLNAGVVDVITKTALAPSDGISTFSNANVPLFRLDGTTDPTWSTVEEPVNATIDGTTVKLGEGQQYYKGRDNAYFIGYYSELTPTRTSNIVSFTGVDGTKDILCTNQVDAGNKTSTTSAELEFNHMLTKVKIEVLGTEASKTAFGKITKIELVDIPTSLDLTLDKASSIAANTTNAVKSPIVLYDETPGMEIPATATALDVIPMIFNGGSSTPLGTSANPLKIKVTTDKVGELTVSVQNITGGLENSKKHTITLTFKDKITVTSSINPWSDSDKGGSGEVG